MQDYYPKEDITFEEFDDVFAQLLNDTKPFYQVLQDGHSINIYETLISLVIFEPNSEFEDKILTLFKAFDVNADESIDKKELIKVL